MSDDAFSLLIRTLGEQMFARESDPMGVVAILISETIRFRDKLKDAAGIVLTVEDTRIALDALEGHLGGQPLPASLTAEQQNLAQIWIDRLTMFRSR